jgi:HSP20 family protein
MSTVLNQVENQTANQEENRARRSLTPVVNIYENKDGYVIEAEMPGVTKSDLEVTLDAKQLQIVGHRHSAPESGKTIYRESEDADFRRSFDLDPTIDTSRISAKIEQGLLTVVLPKTEAIKPRRINVAD